jgi:UPF0755 protein
MLSRVSVVLQSFAIVVLTLGGVLYLGYSLASRFADSPETVSARTVVFTIPAGATTADIGRDLKELKLIQSEVLFEVLVARRDLDGQLRQGAFMLRPNMSLDEILDTFRQAAVVEQTITFPEGWRLEEMASRIGGQTDIDQAEFLQIATEESSSFAGDFSFIEMLPPGHSLEGYLFPDTYQVDSGTTARDLVRRMLQRFEQVVDASLRSAAAEAGLDVHELITLASIIEREAMRDDERALISGVFHNRLAQGVLLQADPTVQYVLGQDGSGGRWWKRDINRSDLQTPSKYNTYVTGGLPPGPIAAPGLKSITAAANPANTSYLFFVARGDGSHEFARTNEEHEVNMKRYLK